MEGGAVIDQLDGGRGSNRSAGWREGQQEISWMEGGAARDQLDEGGGTKYHLDERECTSHHINI